MVSNARLREIIIYHFATQTELNPARLAERLTVSVDRVMEVSVRMVAQGELEQLCIGMEIGNRGEQTPRPIYVRGQKMPRVSTQTILRREARRAGR